MIKLFLNSFLLLFSLTLFATNDSNKVNDTIYTENDIRIYYKSQNIVDGVFIFDKKLKLKERGYIKDSKIKFFDVNNHLTALGGFYNNNLQGNFLYFKEDKLYKSVSLKNGEEEGIALIFDKDGHLDLLYEIIDGKPEGLSLIFENHLPKYIRTNEMNNDSVTLVSFTEKGKIKSISFPNNSKIEEEAEKINQQKK